MAGLKAEINQILNLETEKLTNEKEAKIKEIALKFKNIVSLGAQHVKMGGSKHKIGWANDNEYDADAADK